MFATIRRVLLLVGLVALSACASIVEGTEQSVTIMTEPSGAACKLERQGVVVSLVNPTPGTARIGKSKENVTVLCDKDGHESAAAPLASEFQAMTFGNLIFGGIIGVAVDAGTGAMNKYPDSVSLLPPKSVFRRGPGCLLRAGQGRRLPRGRVGALDGPEILLARQPSPVRGGDQGGRGQAGREDRRAGSQAPPGPDALTRAEGRGTAPPERATGVTRYGRARTRTR